MSIRSTVVFAILLISSPAFSEEKTTFDFTQPVTQFGGKPFTVTDDLSDTEKPIVAALISRGYTIGKPTETTIATIAESVLTIDFRDETLDYMEKAKRYNLAMAISRDPSKVILNAQQISMLEKLVGKAYAPVVVGQVIKVIDPNALN